MKRFLSIILFAIMLCAPAGAQIRNRLKVEDRIFQRYAYGRMQQYNPANIELADSIYQVGVAKDNYKLKALALSLEMSPRFAMKDYVRMDSIAVEIKRLLQPHKGTGDFYYSTLFDYCQFLIYCDRASDAMLEARDMERRASREDNAMGRMYAHKAIGLIQMYRSNSPLAVLNFTKSADYCKEAGEEQELPNLYILIAQELIKMKDYEGAEEYCSMAEEYQDFFPGIKVKATMTRAYLYDSKGDRQDFWKCYSSLMDSPLYKVQVDKDTRLIMDICYLRSRTLFEEALAKADSLGTVRNRYEQKYGVFADLGDYRSAYDNIHSLMTVKDSIYIAVQNEDLAILDAEMNNARLRQEAERLKSRNENTVLFGFIGMFIIAFLAMLVSQWRVRMNLKEMTMKNQEIRTAREAYQRAMDAKELENSMKVKILQNRKNNTYSL